MGVFDRLGDLLKSYLNGEDERIFGKDRPGGGDPDLDAAFEELDDYLGRGPAGGASGPAAGSRRAAGPPRIPESLRPDFAELGLPFGAPAEACKGAYRKLLKIHHPDRHAGHPGNFKKATERTARINAAWDRIEKWRETGAV
jgi:DnaJ-domain-containing protein 1